MTSDQANRHTTPQARRWRLSGHVQGVGFRPFVYRLAHAYGLTGWVQNQMGDVEVFAQGSGERLDAFAADLCDRAPRIARPKMISRQRVPLESLSGFTIRDSLEQEDADIRVPPDYYTCEDCLRELNDPADRRYRYPFINCTQCGPRYTLIARLPYDRPHTAMAGFPLCPACRSEYRNPLDRRFHAEPVACPACGPQLRFVSSAGASIDDGAMALTACVESLIAGLTVAIKGVGGYHLVCDASNDAAVTHLRAHKPRPDKPLAVMFPATGGDELAALREAALPTREEADLLRSPMRPIVLTRLRAGHGLSPAIAPGLAEIGAMLPYSPLHHLLLGAVGRPLVATSGNISGEPVLTDQREAESRLGRVAQAFLHHDRPILRPADDPVFRRIAGVCRPLRLGRGGAPLELELPFELERPVLAVGAHMKNTIALGWNRRAVISPHIGDMGTRRSLLVFAQVADDLQHLYGVQAEAVTCDAHPAYTTGQWARRSGLPVTVVYHHHAHAASVAGEYPAQGDWLVFTWDGVGYGADGTLWGGEALLGRPGAWRRVASLRPFRLPGGDRVAREPWRSAASLCWEAGLSWAACPKDTLLLRQAWERGLNSPWSSAAGRLFDAAAALTGRHHTSSFEGQGPMLLEAVCRQAAEPVAMPLSVNARGVIEADWAPLLPMLMDPRLTVARRGAIFHASLAQSLLQQARKIRGADEFSQIGLCGGVFQNRRLTELATKLLRSNGFSVRIPQQVPVNDAGISFGQIVEFGAQSSGQHPGFQQPLQL